MCSRSDFPPYPDATPAGQVRDALERPDADVEFPEAIDESYNGWSNRATWSAYNWLSSDEMLFRLARARFRLYAPAGDGVRTRTEAMARELLASFGGPLAKRELDLAGGLDAVSWSEIADALIELFDGDDRL